MLWEKEAELELDVAKFQQQLTKVRSELRRAVKEWDEIAEIDLRLNANRLQSELTETRRRLNNLRNVWDTTTSRLQAKFDGLAWWIKGSFSKIWSVLWALGITASLAWITNWIQKITQQAAQVDVLTNAFENFQKASWNDAIKTLNALREASRWAIGEVELLTAANKAQALWVANSAEEFTTLLEIARKKGQDLWLSTTQAFDDLVTGLGRWSVQILDNLGIVVKASEAQDFYAEQLGKTADQLTDAEKKQALLNTVISQGREELEQNWPVATTYAERLAKASNDVNTLFTAIGQNLIPIFTKSSEAVVWIIKVFQDYGKEISFAIVGIGALVFAFNPVFSIVSLTIAWITSLTAAIAFFADGTNVASLTVDEINNWLIENTQITEKLIQKIDELNKKRASGAWLTKEERKELKELNKQLDETNQKTKDLAKLSEDAEWPQKRLAEAAEKLRQANSLYTLSLDRLGKVNKDVTATLENARNEFRLAEFDVLKYQAWIENATNKQDLLDKWLIKLDNAFDQLSTASSQEELQKIQDESVKTLQALIAVQRGIIATENEQLNGAWLLSTRTIQAQRNIQDLQATYFQLQNSVAQNTKRIVWSTNENVENTRSANRKIAQSNKKLVDDTIKQQENLDKLNEENLKKYEKLATDTYETVWQAIENQTEVVQNLNDEITNTQGELDSLSQKASDVAQGAQNDLASRFLEVQERLWELDPTQTVLGTDDLQERQKLLQELTLLQENLSQSEIDEAQRVAWLSETEAILEARDKELLAIEQKKLALEQELLALEESKQKEAVVLEWFAELQNRLNEWVTAKFAEELVKRLQLAQQFQDQIQSFGASFNPSIVFNGNNWQWNTNNISFNSTINSNVDGVALLSDIENTLWQLE